MNYSIGKVSDIAEIISGYAFKSTWFGTGENKVIRISDIQNGVIGTEGATTFDSAANPVSSKFRIKSNDILMALSGATTGKIGVANEEAAGAYLNQRVAVIRGKNEASSRYLKYVFGGQYLDQLLSTAGGAAQPNLSPKTLAELEIPLPPLPEHRRHPR